MSKSSENDDRSTISLSQEPPTVPHANDERRSRRSDPFAIRLSEPSGSLADHPGEVAGRLRRNRRAHLNHYREAAEHVGFPPIGRESAGSRGKAGSVRGIFRICQSIPDARILSGAPAGPSPPTRDDAQLRRRADGRARRAFTMHLSRCWTRSPGPAPDSDDPRQPSRIGHLASRPVFRRRTVIHNTDDQSDSLDLARGMSS